MEAIKRVIAILQVANKFIVALITAGGVLLVAREGGLTSEEAVTVALSFLGALGVYAVPNKVK